MRIAAAEKAPVDRQQVQQFGIHETVEGTHYEGAASSS